jgi:hypothetical protein
MRTSASRSVTQAAVAVTAALLAVAPSAGAASGWTTPAVFDGTDIELTPRAAIAADGTSAVAWSTACCKKRALVVSTGRANGFGPPRVIHRPRPNDYSVAAGPGGAFLVAWGDADGLRVAVRTATGRPIVVRRVFAPKRSEIMGVQVAPDPRGGWVIVAGESPKEGSPRIGLRVRGLSLDRAGRRVGPARDLGPGVFGGDARQTQALAVDREGRAVFAFTRLETVAVPGPEPQVADVSVGPVMVSTRLHGRAFSEPVAVPGPAMEPRVAVRTGGRAVLATVRTDSCAESGCFGPPGVALIAAGAAPASPFGPSIDRPYRVFAPTAALTASNRGVLVFQLKTKRAPFSKEAPVRAVTFAADGTLGPLQTLTPARAHEPVVMPLSGGRALVVWAERQRIGAALTGPNGRFQTTAGPSGPPPNGGHINPTNRDLHTAGRYAIFAWEANGRARISVRRL